MITTERIQNVRLLETSDLEKMYDIVVANANTKRGTHDTYAANFNKQSFVLVMLQR